MWSKSILFNLSGVIAWPHFMQTVKREAFTFARLILDFLTTLDAFSQKRQPEGCPFPLYRDCIVTSKDSLNSQNQQVLWIVGVPDGI